jgi:hypothetical protein
MNHRTRCFLLLAALVIPVALSAQADAESVRLRTAIVRALRDDAPPTPLLLVYSADSDAATVARVGVQLGIASRRVAGDLPVKVFGGDTVAIRVTITDKSDSTASAMVDLWGALLRPSSKGPTSWFSRRRATIVKRDGGWVVTRLTTMMES